MNTLLRPLITSFFTFLATICFSQTFQNVPFYGIQTQIAPQNPKLKEFKTFDVRLVKASGFETNIEANEIEFSKLLNGVSVKSMKQVETGGDLHIVVLLQKYVPTSNGAFVYFYFTLYDKFMNKIDSYQSNWENRTVSSSKKINSKEGVKGNLRANVETALEDIFEYVYKISTEGSEKRLEVSLAQFEKVKKYPDLQDFNTIVDETEKILRKEGSNAWLKEITSDDLKYWGEFVDEKEDTENNDIKRVALHNLTVYHILKNDEKKAREYFKKYEAIDVEIKDGALGEKYKPSKSVANLLYTVFPQEASKNLLTQELSTDEIFERHQYISFKGIVEPVEGSKILKENFNGIIRIMRPEPDFQDPTITASGARSIGGTDKGAMIKLIDDKGVISKVMSSDIAKISSDDNKAEYVVRKFKILTFTYFILMERTFKGDKIALYQELFPEKGPQNVSSEQRTDYTPETYFWMQLKDDSEGMQTTVINMKKKIFEYLSDCPKLKDKYQEKSFKPAVVLELVTDFEKCK
jgi:hypothetical protein